MADPLEDSLESFEKNSKRRRVTHTVSPNEAPDSSLQNQTFMGHEDVSHEAYLTDAFVRDYAATPSSNKYFFLITTFNEMWDRFNLRPETIASLIRKKLDNLAPKNKSGHPDIPIPQGFTCHYKAQLALVGLHTSPMMGVATAIVVNGGYQDDVDRGTDFIYVGEGGEQSGESQSLNRGNLGLLNACEKGAPVRVIRGFKAFSQHAPSWGFRYDGLYEISQGYWDVGKQDRRVWKYVMKALDCNQMPPKCGCEPSAVVQHENGPSDSLYPPHFIPRPHKKLQTLTIKQIMAHQKSQASRVDEPKRLINVMAVDGNFKLSVSQLLDRPSGRFLVKSPFVKDAIPEIKSEIIHAGRTDVVFTNPVQSTSISASSILPVTLVVAEQSTPPTSPSHLIHSHSTKSPVNMLRSYGSAEDPLNKSTPSQNVDATLSEVSSGQLIQQSQPLEKGGVSPDVTAKLSSTPKKFSSNSLDIQILPRTPANAALYRNVSRFRLPSFASLLSGILRASLPIYRETVYRTYNMDNSNPEKPNWARYSFLPFSYIIAFRETNVLDDPRTLRLPINRKLASQHALPYFPQSRKDHIHGRILLEPPLPADWNPYSDISQGQEHIPIPANNTLDDVPPPTDFTYVRSSIVLSVPPIAFRNFCSGCVPVGVDTSSWTQVPGALDKCGGLMDPQTNRIYCRGMNISNPRIRGDCSHQFCPCSSQLCDNRHFRKGIQFPVEIKRVENLGWGLFSRSFIPKGAFLMEYAGDLINFGELKARVHKYEKTTQHNFTFEIFQADENDLTEAWKYPCVDASHFGNVARFVNHSCDPNLQTYAHCHDGNCGRSCSLFALRDIQAGEELQYDYGESYTKNLKCLCGSIKCRKYVGQTHLGPIRT